MTNLQEGYPSFVSIEGARGVGKTTLINRVIDSGEYVNNRDIKANLEKTESGETAKRMRKAWHQMYRVERNTLVFENPQVAETLAWSKFHHMLFHIHQRQKSIFDFVSEGKILIRDRYIDTTVVYDAIDIILSNRTAYRTERSRVNLLHSMWKMALSICDLPSKTVYLSTSNPDSILLRGHNFKGNDDKLGYKLDEYQTLSQRLAIQIYPQSFKQRHLLMPQFGFLEVCTDGLTAEEVFKMVQNYISL